MLKISSVSRVSPLFTLSILSKVSLTAGWVVPSLVALVGFAPESFARSQIRSTTEHVPGEIVVQLKDASRARVAAAIEALERRLGQNAVLDIRSLKTDPTLHVLKIARDTELKQAISTLNTEVSVEIAEPNYIYRISDDGSPEGLPNDPAFAKTWGIKNTGQKDASGQAGNVGSDVSVVPLWQEGFTGSLKVLVGVIDTGIDWDHEDLQANIYTNLKEAGDLSTDKIDNDGNGFVDDIHGWNFAKNTNDSRDDHNHGTHCAGTIGAQGNNGIGVAGVNWNVSLLPIKFLDSHGSGSMSAAVESINYATLMKANLTSNSWGGGSYAEILKKAIERARDAGIMFVAAAGNDSTNNDTSPTYPATYQVENVVSVAATDNRDTIASFSNYGATKVHVAAPGVKIYSTVKGSKYDHMSGTSMAAPHVAGVAALLLASKPEWGFADVKRQLVKTSDPVRGLKRKVLAKGRVSAYNALHDIVPPSVEPDESLWKTEELIVESEHPYKDREDAAFTVTRPGAKFIRVHFEKVEVENRYDKVVVQNVAGTEVLEVLTGKLANYTSEYVEGDTLVIRLKADESNSSYGFKIDKVQVIY